MPLYNLGTQQQGSILAFLINTKQTLTNSTSLTTLASKVISASKLSANCILRVTALYTFTNNANSKSIYIKVGGSDLIVFGSATQNIRSLVLQRDLVFRNSLQSQVVQQNGSTSFSSYTTSASELSIDFTQDQNIIFSAQNSVSTDTTVLEYAFGQILI